jgi:hypothetical protein
MSNNADLADNLGNVKQALIPTESRMQVLVCPGVPDEARARWLTQGGDSKFHTVDIRPGDSLDNWGKDLSKVCGIVLFITGPHGYLDRDTSAILSVFYKQGTETNAFQWQPIEKNFVRRDPDWYNDRKTTT